LFLLAMPATVVGLTLSLDQDAYVVGEVIEITIANPDDEAVEFPGEPPFSIHRLDGEYEFITTLPVIVVLGAGETMVLSWDTGMLPDPAGQYEVVVDWWYQQDPAETFVITAPYTLDDVVGLESTTWSSVLRLFR
jgi:hypothetical protein